MAFLMKSMLSNQVKNLGLGGGGEESKEESTPSDPAAAAGMTREEYEEYQKQMVEEKWVSVPLLWVLILGNFVQIKITQEKAKHATLHYFVFLKQINLC